MIKIKNIFGSKNRWVYSAIPLSSVSKDYIEKKYSWSLYRHPGLPKPA